MSDRRIGFYHMRLNNKDHLMIHPTLGLGQNTSANLFEDNRPEGIH